jgi:hypothetical protein
MTRGRKTPEGAASGSAGTGAAVDRHASARRPLEVSLGKRRNRNRLAQSGRLSGTEERASDNAPIVESELAARVREELNGGIDWSTEAQIKARAKRAKAKRAGSSDSLWGLPEDPAPTRVGVPAKGQPKPTDHEAAILRRLAQPGAFVLVTLRPGKDPLFSYEDGTLVLGEHRAPLRPNAWKRLRQFLVPELRGSLFNDGPPQRFYARRPALAPTGEHPRK